MVNFFRLLYLLTVHIIVSNAAFCQLISAGFTSVWTHTNQVVKLVNSKEDFQNTDYGYCISYEHFLQNERFSIFCSFNKFDGYTFIRFNNGSVIAPDGFPVIGDGFSGVIINRYDIGLYYNLIKGKNRFYIKPFAGCGMQLSATNGEEYGNFFKVNGPDYFELKPITAIAFNTTQIIPTIGFKTGFLLWKRIDLSLLVQGTYGFKSYQNMYFKYAYKGVPQETAVFEATGTGLYFTLGVGYRFIKLLKVSKRK